MKTFQLSGFDGRNMATALGEEPGLCLSFYSYGCILRKRVGESYSEYPVDIRQVATSLAAKVSFDTGLLDGDTLLIREEGAKRIVVGFRKRQKTGIWLEGSDDAIRVPLPDMLMIRSTRNNESPDYQVYAVKARPEKLDVELFHCPLPNIYNSGSICWGTVKQPDKQTLARGSLKADFSMLIGSPFGTHSCNGKSKKYPRDIRKMFIDMEERKARVYPRSDLIPAKKTLAKVLKGLA